MEYPKVDDNYFQERMGVLALAKKVNELKCIWRETPNADVGIDGQIELVDGRGQSTGQLVAVQVKSGKSYVEKGDDQKILYYASEKHRNYWQNFPIPVLIVIHNPQNDMAYWVDARRFLRSPMNQKRASIPIPRDQIVDTANKDKMFESAGPVEGRVLKSEIIPQVMASMRIKELDCELSFFDLFGFGIVDIGARLFFSMHLCLEIGEIRAANNGVGFGGSSSFYSFVEGYVKFLVSQNLAYVDYSDFLIQWEEREMVPMFIAPLTPRGRDVLNIMSSMEGATGLFYEGLLRFEDHFRWSLPPRLEVADALQERLREQIKKKS
jgi:hypothetical protein